MERITLFSDTRIYKHFKGGLYRILCEAHDSETRHVHIIYQCIKTGTVWSRKKGEFFGNHESGVKRFEAIEDPQVTGWVKVNPEDS